MAAAAKAGANATPAPIIVKKIIVAGHGGHHGGAWKVAYADFVTAMMAFFLLMWLLGATTEKQRKGIADYFTPTITQMKEGSAGSNNGLFGGDSLTKPDSYPHSAGQTGPKALTIPRDSADTAATKAGAGATDQARFAEVQRRIKARLAARKDLKRLLKNIRFTETREGLRIDLVDEADFAMFRMATDAMTPDARALVGEVAAVAADMPNDLIVRGHTDALPYAAGKAMNNWRLSAARAEATRLALRASGVSDRRFARIEGVAEREPWNPKDIYDPRNRRMSITLAWSGKAS